MNPDITRLSDEQLRMIFRTVAENQLVGVNAVEARFLSSYANAAIVATHADFMMMRSISLIFVAKYHLGRMLKANKAA